MIKISSFISRVGIGGYAGRVFAHVCDQLLLHEAKANGFDFYCPSDSIGDYKGVDAYSLPTNKGNFEGIGGKVGFQYKCIPSESGKLDASRKAQIVSSLKRATNENDDLCLWILITPEDFNKNQQNWFDALVDIQNVPFRIKHWGHKELERLYRKHPEVVSGWYPELVTEHVNIPSLGHQLDIIELSRKCQEVSSQSLRYLAGETGDLSSKYIPELYVDRQEYKTHIENFLQHEKICFALIGTAGIGKTNLLCNLSSRPSETTLFLFYDAQYIQTSLEDTLSYTFEAILECPFLELIRNLSGCLSEHKKQLLIIIDAINESQNYRKLRLELPNILDVLLTAEGRIKVILSCRDIDWTFFARRNNKLCAHIYRPFSSLDRHDVQTSGSLMLDVFDKDSFSRLWKRYASIYNLEGRPNAKVRRICKHPLMMRFLAEGFQGSQIPTDINRLEILDRYWEQKLANRDFDTKSSAQSLLFQVVSKMYRDRRNELAFDVIENLTGESLASFNSTFTRVLSENVLRYIFYIRNVGKSGRNFIGFTYESFQEYVLAKHIYWKDNWESKGDDDLKASLEKLMDEAARYRTTIGAVEFLVLMCEGREDKAGHMLIASLVSSGSVWQAVACSILTKLKDINVEVVELYEPIANKASWQRRKLYASSIAARLEDNPPLRKYLLEASKKCVHEAHSLLKERPFPLIVTGLLPDQKKRLRLLLSQVNTLAWTIQSICDRYSSSRKLNKFSEHLCSYLIDCVACLGGITSGPSKGEPPDDALWNKIIDIFEKITSTRNSLLQPTYDFLVNHPQGVIRYRARLFFVKRNDPGYKAALWRLLSMETEDSGFLEMKLDAAVSLAELKDKRAYDYLVCRLHDEENRVKQQAIEGLAELGLKKAIGHITETLYNSGDAVWNSAIRALAELEATEKTIPVLKFLIDRQEFKDAVSTILIPRNCRPRRLECPYLARIDLVFESTLKRFFEIGNKDVIKEFLSSELEMARGKSKKSEAIGWLLNILGT
jgi:hypothetical protein